MKSEDIRKLITSVKDDTNQVKRRAANENLNTSSRNQDRSPALKTSKSNNALLTRSPIDSKYDGSFTSYTNAKTNKNKLADLLNYKSDLNFAEMALDVTRKESSNQPKDDDANFSNPDNSQTREHSKSVTNRFRSSTSETNERSKEARNNRPTQSDNSQLVMMLTEENKAMRVTLADYQLAFEYLIKKHKELKKELNYSAIKDDRISDLEQALLQERQRNQFLRNRNSILREKFLNLVDKLRKGSANAEEEENEDDTFYANVTTQNAQLRQILQLAKVADPLFSPLDQLLKKEEQHESQGSLDDEATEHSTHSFAKWRLQHYHIDTTKTDKSSHIEAQDTSDSTKNLIDNFKKERMEMFASKRSFSAEGDLPSAGSHRSLEIPVGADNTPILNRNIHNTSHSSDSSQESNHITFVSRNSSTSSVSSIPAAQQGTITPLKFTSMFKTIAKDLTE